jgi:hypothetical protein
MKPKFASALALSCLSLATIFVVAFGACNEHVFEVIEPCATRVIQEEVPVALSKAADILLVIDNSGSMCEEQENLVQNFFDDNCRITDLSNVPEEYQNPSDDLIAELAEECGFIQMLAAFDNDYRVGVITTDVSLADNKFGLAEGDELTYHCDGQAKPDFGRRPQRGCLQAVPGSAKKYIERGDENSGQIFKDTLEYVSTYGSGFERGLDATRIFLDPSQTRHPDCLDDATDFIRSSAQLIVIYLTDEDDCSHENSESFPDENEGDDGLTSQTSWPNGIFPKICYERPDEMVPPDEYAEFLKALKGPGREEDVRVAVVAGSIFNEEGGLEYEGCRIVDGAPNGQCEPSFGNSIDPRLCPGDEEPVCCEADSGKRYYDLANAMGAGNALTDSICFASFRRTMVDIAQFAARIEFVELSEAPASPGAILVRIMRSGEEDPEDIARIPEGEDPTGQNGWQLEGDRRIRFYGTALPQPGDEILVSALGDRETSQESNCTGSIEENTGSGGQTDAGSQSNGGDAGQ